MKTTLILAASILTQTLIAQQPAASSGDPFTRDGAAATATDASPQQAQLYGLFEYIEVPTADWLAYSTEHPTRADSTELRAEVQRWIEAGKAKHYELACVTTLSGHRTTLASVLERRYPTDWAPAAPQAVPLSFETRDIHLSIEWEPVLDENARELDSQFALRLENSFGETPTSRSPGSPGFGEVHHPRVAANKQSLALRAHLNTPMLVNVSTPSEANGSPRNDVQLLTFFKATPAKVSPPKGQPSLSTLTYFEGEKRVTIPLARWEAIQAAAAKDPAAKATAERVREQLDSRRASIETAQHYLEVEHFEVTLKDLGEWFSKRPLDQATSELRGNALEWIRLGRGKILNRAGGPIRSGNRVVWENVREVRYSSTYTVDGRPMDIELPRDVRPRSYTDFLLDRFVKHTTTPGLLKNPAVVTFSAETRNTGLSIEAEPVISADGGFATSAFSIRNTRLAGFVTFYEQVVDTKVHSKIEQPMFAFMRTDTSITLSIGNPSLMGIHTPMQDDFQPSPDRRVLTFVTIRN